MPREESSAQLCPICDRDSAAPWLTVPNVVTADATPAAFRLYRCSGCEYGFVHPRPTPERVRDFYPEGYYTHRPLSAGSAGFKLPLLDRLLVHLAWRMDRGIAMFDTIRRLGVETARACDIGCGAGRLLRQACDAGADAVGVEVDERARANARGLGLEVLDGTAELLPAELEPGTFDLVWMSHVLEHCLDPIAGLANIAGLLKPGGRVLIEVPNNECIGMERSGIAWRWLDVPRHLNFFARASLVAACRRVGLEVETVEFYGYVRQFLPDWIETEAEQRRLFAKAAASHGTAVPPAGRRPPRSLLLATAIAPAARRYDSVRVIARWPA